MYLSSCCFPKNPGEDLERPHPCHACLPGLKAWWAMLEVSCLLAAVLCADFLQPLQQYSNTKWSVDAENSCSSLRRLPGLNFAWVMLHNSPSLLRGSAWQMHVAWIFVIYVVAVPVPETGGQKKGCSPGLLARGCTTWWAHFWRKHWRVQGLLLGLTPGSFAPCMALYGAQHGMNFNQ